MGMSLGFSMSPRLVLSQKVLQTQWNLVNAYKKEEDTGCKIPKRILEGVRNLDLEQRLRRVDDANELFRYVYTKIGRSYFKIPVIRDRNVESDETRIKISKEDYTLARAIIKKAGRIQRIVRAIPYNEIRKTIIEHIKTKQLDVDDVVLVGVDRGGRLPTHIVCESLGKDKAYFLKVDQGGCAIDTRRLQELSDRDIFRNKYILFVDSTVDSGRQINALQRYFDDEQLKEKLGHNGWIVLGSNEDGVSLENHVNIEWGLDPDEAFEDNPELIGVDYAMANNKVMACGNKMSSYIRKMLLEVPKGIVLDTTADQEQKVSKTKNLLIIGDGSNVTIDETNANALALKLEHGFNVLAGTTEGNPGYILELISKYPGRAGIILVQPEYMIGATYKNGFEVVYEGKTKEQFRDYMIEKADVVIAIGGNEGTWAEIKKAVEKGKPTIFVKDLGIAGKKAAKELGDNKDICMVDSLERVLDIIGSYR